MKKTMMILSALVLIASQTALFAQGQNETAD